MAPSCYARAKSRTAVPELVLGPLLRHVGPSDATFWVETDSPCEVEVRAGRPSTRSPTFRVGAHHYALVHVTGLAPGVSHEYEVRLDGEVVWPEPGAHFPPSVVRSPGEGEHIKLVFGSCRITAPHEPPYTLSYTDDARGLGADVLYALAMCLCGERAEELPPALVLLGGQVYAHRLPHDTLDFIR